MASGQARQFQTPSWPRRRPPKQASREASVEVRPPARQALMTVIACPCSSLHRRAWVAAYAAKTVGEVSSETPPRRVGERPRMNKRREMGGSVQLRSREPLALEIAWQAHARRIRSPCNRLETGAVSSYGTRRAIKSRRRRRCRRRTRAFGSFKIFLPRPTGSVTS